MMSARLDAEAPALEDGIYSMVLTNNQRSTEVEICGQIRNNVTTISGKLLMKILLVEILTQCK